MSMIPDYRDVDGNLYNREAINNAINRSEADRLTKHEMLTKGVFPKSFQQMGDAAAEIKRQLSVINKAKGVYIEGITSLPRSFSPVSLNAEMLARLSEAKRAKLLLSLLKTLSFLEENGVFPGPMYLDGIIVDGKLDHDTAYLNAENFQIGSLSYTYQMFRGDYLDPVQYPYFNSELQKVADARLVHKFLVSLSDNLNGDIVPGDLPAQLIEMLTNDPLPSAKELIEVIESIEFSDECAHSNGAPTAGGRLAVCYLAAPCRSVSSVNAVEKQIYTVKTMLRSLDGGIDTDEAFIYSNAAEDTAYRSGKARLLPFRRFSQSFYPNIPNDKALDDPYVRREAFLHSYIEAEAAVRIYLDEHASGKAIMLILLTEDSDAGMITEHIRAFLKNSRGRCEAAWLYLRSGKAVVPSVGSIGQSYMTDDCSACSDLQTFLADHM